MRFVVVAVTLFACRGEPHAGAGSGSGSSVVQAPLVPRVLASEDGVAEMKILDREIEISRGEAIRHVPFLMTRASFRGRLEDYQAAVEETAHWVETVTPPNDQVAWEMRTRALAAVHDFAAARAALEEVKKRSRDPSTWADLATSLDEAAGPRTRSIAARSEAARTHPTATTLALYAASLAFQGRFDDAIAQIPRANSALRDNLPETVAWLLFQWGRLYEQKGDLAAARAFYQEAHARLPSYVEANAHLAQTLIATGDSAAAKAVVTSALVADRHPALLELAAQLGLGSVDDARAAWERYVTALPMAFSDHAARYYLGVGRDPKRALELARANLANRDVPEARELVIQAALAAGDPPTACEVATGLTDAPLRAHRFAAWQAFSRCGRTAEAARLARDLGI